MINYRTACYFLDQFPHSMKWHDYIFHGLGAGGDSSIDVKGRRKVGAKALDFMRFSAPDGFERVERVIVCGSLSKGNSRQKVLELSCHDRCHYVELPS